MKKEYHTYLWDPEVGDILLPKNPDDGVFLHTYQVVAINGDAVDLVCVDSCSADGQHATDTDMTQFLRSLSIDEWTQVHPEEHPTIDGWWE
jgi:hypothetical protein